MKNKYELVMFDMDGTFIASREFHALVFTRFFNKYVMSVEHEEIKKAMGNTVWEIFEKFGVDKEHFRTLFGELNSFCMTEVDDLIDDIPLAADIHDTLTVLKKQGKKTALVTNSIEGVAHSILEHFSLIDLFDVVVGADIESATKNERCEKVRNACGVDKDKTLYVGDSESDIVLAKQLSYDSCFADTEMSWAKNREYIYEELKPTMAVKSLYGLIGYLE